MREESVKSTGLRLQSPEKLKGPHRMLWEFMNGNVGFAALMDAYAQDATKGLPAEHEMEYHQQAKEWSRMARSPALDIEDVEHAIRMFVTFSMVLLIEDSQPENIRADHSA